VDAAGANLDAAIDANARIQANLLSKASPHHRRGHQGRETEGRIGPLRHRERKSRVARLSFDLGGYLNPVEFERKVGLA
jgi:hypothetical protein